MAERAQWTCHESSSWPSVRLPQEVAPPSYWLSHHIDCYTSPWTAFPIIHCTDHTHMSPITCSLESYYTLYNTHSEPVQIAEYCSAFIIVIADSHYTEPVLVIVIVLLVIFLCFDSSLCILDLPFALPLQTLFAPAWTIAMYLDYLSLPCPVGYCLPIEDLRFL